ncbi:Acyl transferase 15 [Zea mays]|uniref:Acyl transferase 15 n=1 Tax=Zea mays TaxID=4577 RepID=A0A3L6G3L0_MAIZE|nr:Acyl transferase 15 [Zea mays]
MSMVIKSPSVVLRPPTTAAGEKISLSPLDKANFPLSVLLLYHPSPVDDAANTIKRALSQALVHYYPFCGRIVDGSHIECTGEGAVEFVAASADCSLKQAAAAKLHERPSFLSLVEELAVYYPMGSYGAADPLLTVQVTEFACGGFALGATWSHAVADGAGVAQLLGAVGELARGLPTAPSVAPVRWDAAVSSQPPQPDPGRDAVMASLPAWFDDPAAAEGHSFMQALEPLPLALLDVTVPTSFISRVKAELPGSTTFEAVLAALWQCRTRAILSSSGGGGGPADDGAFFLSSSVSFAVNVRRHVGAKDGYYGNCVVDELVTASSSTVASAGVVHLVEMIKRAKEQRVILWRNIGFEDVDFGSGQPARVMCHVPGVPPIPGCIACLRCEGRDGVNVLSCCVKEEHADAFLAEIAKLG